MKDGYAALISVIVLGAVMVLVGLTATLTSINSGQSSLSTSKSHQLTSLVDACTEESLLTINKNNTLPPTIITVLGGCTATVNSHVGTSWDITLTGGDGVYLKSTNVKLDRSTTLNLSNWQEQ